MKKFRFGTARFLLALALLAGSGCRIRDYMVPWIVDGELEKIKTQQAHRCDSVAWVMRGDSAQRVDYTVDFAPPDRLRYEFQPSSATGAAIVLCVSTEAFMLYDPCSNRAERVAGLPPFSEQTFVEFRKAALRHTLEQNRAYAENAKEDPNQFWVVRTEPKEDSPWPFGTSSYISKETKNNLRATEQDKSGKILNRFETTERTYEVDFPAGYFTVRLPEGCAVVEYDLSTLRPLDPGDSDFPERVPREHAGLALARIHRSPDRRVFDYTLRQRVLFYAERRQDEAPLLRSPVSREVALPDSKAYINYAGTYTTCRWRSGGWDRLIFTNLGPEQAFALARHLTLREQEATLPAAGAPEQQR